MHVLWSADSLAALLLLKESTVERNKTGSQMEPRPRHRVMAGCPVQVAEDW